MLRLLAFGFILAIVIIFNVSALVHIEDDNGQDWECDAFYCYSDEVRKERDEFEDWLKQEDETKAKYTKDPLSMTNTKDPLAMPKPKTINNNDSLAF